MAIIIDGKELGFEPPGPGSWRLDNVHVPRPWTRFQGEMHGGNVWIGAGESARRYGALSGRGYFAFVHGFGYGQANPAPAEEWPARFAAAEETFATRRWRTDLARWESEVKPATIRAQMALQAVDPATLDDAGLARHLAACQHNLALMVQQHHQFNMPATLPIGDLIAHLRSWTDLPLGAFLALVRGSAPESAGSYAELSQLAAAIRATPAARAMLADSDPGEAIARLRAAGGKVGAAATGYLDLVGYRLLDSLDTGDPYALEVPEVLVKAIRLAVETTAPASAHATAEEEARIRDMLPAQHRDTFLTLLAEARHNSSLRDERGLYSDVWAAGICRRAILEAGARLAARGRLHAAAHLVECGWAEMQGVLRGEPTPSADELARRRWFRDTFKASDAPPALGDPPKPPALPPGLPAAALRIARAMAASGDAMFAVATEANEPTRLRGIGASPGTYTGTARLIASPAEFGRLQPGDVLVTATTTESFNIVLPLLGAIVTDAGGLLSHAAIVSREYGIPGVVGTREATRRIADGATVRVDGLKGEVVLVSA